jgi:transglutaminase-like putative cysteine protease
MKKAHTLEGVINNLTSFAGDPRLQELDWQATLLVVSLVQLASTRLAITEWVPSLNVTQVLSLYAVVLGLALGYSNLTRRNVIWMAIEYGLLVIPLQLISATERTENIYEDLRHLFGRVFESFDLFFRSQPVYDTLFFVLLTSVGLWVVGLYAGYHFSRHGSYLNTVVPPGLIILIVQIYDPWMPLRAWGLALYIFVALALLGRMHYTVNKARWKKQHVFFSSDTEWEFTRSILLTAVIAVLLAWTLPGVVTNIKPVTRAWRDLTRPFIERLSDAVRALDSPYGTSPSGDFYGTDLKLGSNAPLSDTQVFTVDIVREDAPVLRYYWRGRVYEHYENGQWNNTTSRSRAFDPLVDEISSMQGSDQNEVQLEISINFPKQELLYGPSEMTWVNRSGRMSVAPIDGDVVEVLAWFADPALAAGATYEVHARIANPSIQDLRAAGVDYPDWVIENYLQVPAQIQPELKELAEQITASYEIPYDRTQAITSYLRHQIQYETKITGTPPRGVDPLLWVLFDYKKGFCMYYASAEVLMLRTLGIPARLAVGFAQGQYDEANERYEVARLNSHAWPEVYFPGIGWVEFEPTANQDLLNRPQERIETTNDDPANNGPQGPLALPDVDLENLTGFDRAQDEEGELVVSSTGNSWAQFILPGSLILILAIGVYLVRRHSVTMRLPVYLAERYARNGTQPPPWLSNWAKWSSLLPIERSFQTINLSLRWLGEPRLRHATPAERAHRLAKAMPAARESIDQLAHEYEMALFSARPANLSTARRASLRIILETWRTRVFHYREYLKRRYN